MTNGTFSISDAQNEAGEWLMSPEQIRSEMAANAEPEYFDCCGVYGRCACGYDDDDD